MSSYKGDWQGVKITNIISLRRWR